MHVSILDKVWELVFLRLDKRRDWWGKTDPPDAVNKKIRIEGGHTDQEILDTLLHEFMHAGNWSLDEDHVDQWASNTSKILTELGWRRDPNVPLPYKTKIARTGS